VISGDPSKTGAYTVRLMFPAGYRFPVHWHPGAENLTVVSGTFQLGMGNTRIGPRSRATGRATTSTSRRATLILVAAPRRVLCDSAARPGSVPGHRRSADVNPGSFQRGKFSAARYPLFAMRCSLRPIDRSVLRSWRTAGGEER